jgi:hypothetical protein
MTRDGVQLAYSRVGSGPPLVKTGNWMTHLEFDFESPIWRHLYRELWRDHSLIRYDARGNGLSDRDRQRPGHDWRGQRWRSPGSRSKGFCACQGLRRRGASMCLAISTPAVLPSVGRKTSAPRTCLTPLNTSPAPSPVNASRLPSRTARASLGAGAVRYSFTVTDFHHPPLARSPAHSPTPSHRPFLLVSTYPLAEVGFNKVNGLASQSRAA